VNQLKALLENAQSWFTSLSTREKRMVLATGGVVVVFALALTLFQLSSAASATLQRTANKTKYMLEVQELAGSYRDAEAQRAQILRQLSNNGIKLMSYVDQKGTAAGLDMQTMNPKGDVPVGDGNILENAVEVTLTDVNIRKLTEFLNTVEQGGLVKVKNLRMEPRVQNETLTAWITVVTYRSKP
jgi:general secretion pathway protein M